MTFPVKLLRPKASLPRRATSGSAGMDLCACVETPLPIPAGETRVVPTGIAMAIPEGAVALVFGRSGLGIRNGIVPANAVGVIDSDYRGEIQVGLLNHSREDYVLQPGERIAQLVMMPILTADPIEADALSPTDRGTGGLGSTGRL